MGPARDPGRTVTWLSGTVVAVTGASGFCGGWVARAASAAGARVVCLGRRPGPVGELRPWDATAGASDLSEVDVVIHLAAAVGDPGAGPATERRFHAVNVTGGARLLDEAHGRPVVWMSSASVYNPRVSRHSVGEDHPVGGGLNAYARTKAAGDLLARQAGAVVLRPHAVYGPGDAHLLPRLQRAVRRGVAVLPGRDVQLSVTAVQNLADACLAALRWPAGAYNIADAEPQSRDTLVRTALAAAGTPVRVRHVPAGIAGAAAAVAARLPIRDPLLTAYAVDQLSHDIVLDTTKARSLGWQPTRTVEDYLALR
ncbi:MAG: NAD(P)-dependent oxidoreductase [Actinomycetota bacterium]|nr:NAD(P)-dependent oxidoreductase [Actinomycetota bacterium]